MSRQYLHTELRSELEAVELAWDVFLNNVDETLVEPLISFMSRTAEDWVLVGQRHFVDRLVQFSRGTVEFSCIVVESSRAIREAQIDELVQHTHRVIGSNTHIFLCVSDRYDACRIAAGLPQTCSIHTLDLLKELVGERLPAAVWREKFDHIYPIKIPEVRIRKHLDVLLLDMPARSLAQLPIGFAYVYKALRQTGLHLQAIDVDLIAYHRYHSRRCLNYIDRILHEGMLHPQDPWQAENYIVWTDKKFIDYFSDILDEVVEKVVEANPKIVAFSLHQTSHVSIEKVVARLRAALPEVRIVVGGMSCYQHFVARRIFPQADYVVVGEADTVIAPLMEALARGERPADVPGVVSRYDSADRTFIAAPLPHNLDIIGGPDYGFTNLDLYVNWNGYRLMPLVGSRGCGWSRCTFCAERFNWRARTPEKVAEEIENYVARGFKDFVFNESDFNSNPSFVIRLCRDIVRRGIKANFTAQLRIGKDCDFEYYKAMKDAGFTCLRFGVDGLSENTLLLQRKGYTKEMVMQNLKHCHDLGIFTEINVVIGVPGETDADVEESADFIIEMKPYIGRVAFINPLMMFVGSVYYFEPERHQIKFVENKEELYKNYFVSLPDSSWYSENPYIDHNIRRQRFFRIVERIREVGVPLGAFANFTAAFRKDHQEDSHTLSQPKPHTTDIAPGTESATLSTQLEEKTEFQNTFYGSWSGLFLSGNSWRTDEAAPLHDRRVVRLNDEFYYAKETIVRKSEMINFYACPFLLKSYKGYNLVGYRDQILGAPIVLGPIDLTQDDATNDIRILKGQTEDEVASIIDWIHAAVNLANDPPVPQTHRTIAARGALTRRFFDVPTLLRSYKNYNLVGYRDQILGAPLSLGPIDLTQDSARMDDRIIKGQTEDDVTAKIDALNSGDRDAQVGPERNTRSLVSQATGRKVNMGPGVLLRWGN